MVACLGPLGRWWGENKRKLNVASLMENDSIIMNYIFIFEIYL